MATSKYNVVHPKLYFTVSGKKQHCEKDSFLNLTTKQAELLGNKVAKPGTTKTVTPDAPVEEPAA